MGSALVDIVKVVCNSTGTGSITLGQAVNSFRGVEALVNNTTYSYSIQEDYGWEYGRCVYLSAGNQLIRTPINSSDGGAPINLAANAQIAFVALAEDLDAVILSNAAIKAAQSANNSASAAAADAAAAKAASVTAAEDAAARTAEAAAEKAAAATLARIGRREDPREFELSGLSSSSATEDGYLIEGRAEDGSRVTIGPDYDAPIIQIPKVIGVGSSLVEQGIVPKFTAAMAKPERLGILLPGANLGRSGATSRAISINFGGQTVLYRPVGGVIPASKVPVDLLPVDGGPLDGYGGPGGETLCKIAGVLGKITWASGKPQFTREVAGKAVGVPFPVPYEPVFYDRDSLWQYNHAGGKQRKVVDDARDCFAIFWAMRNDIYDSENPLFYADLAIRRYQELIERLRPRLANFIIFTEIPSTTEVGNSLSLANINGMNAAVLEEWPNNACDITTGFLAADQPRGSLMNDGYLHPSPAGQEIICEIAADFAMTNKLLTDVQG